MGFYAIFPPGSGGGGGGGGGTVTSVSFVDANGFTGTVANPTTTPALTLTGLTLAGDVTGPATSNTVSKLQGVTLTAPTPSSGQVLGYNGTAWVPTTPSSGTPGGATNSIQYNNAGSFGGFGAFDPAHQSVAFGTPGGGVINAPSNGSLAFGENGTGSTITATAGGSLAFGHTDALSSIISATNQGSLAFGFSQNGTSITAAGPASLAMGATLHTITSSGVASFAGGYSSVGALTASGDGSFVYGDAHNVSATNATAFGLGNANSSYASLAIGRYAVSTGTPTSWISTDPAFTIGNGISGTPNNAFQVLKDGTTFIADPSLSGSSVGWVFTLQNTTTGQGAWAASGGGGLTPPLTSSTGYADFVEGSNTGGFIGVDTDADQTNKLIYIGSTQEATTAAFNTSNVVLLTGSNIVTAASGDTGNMILSTGAVPGGSSTANSGGLSIVTGNTGGTGNTGAIAIQPGLSNNSAGGSLTLSGGNAGGTVAAGGVTINGGVNSGTGGGGNIVLIPGTGTPNAKIQLQDNSGTITAGEVWTATDTSGNGLWQAIGANPITQNLAPVTDNTLNLGFGGSGYSNVQTYAINSDATLTVTSGSSTTFTATAITLNAQTQIGTTASTPTHLLNTSTGTPTLPGADPNITGYISITINGTLQYIPYYT